MDRTNSHLNTRYIKVLSFLICIMFLVSSCSNNSTQSGDQAYNLKTDFSDGKFDASGLVDVAGTNGVLFVDNTRQGQVLWMQLDENGRQAGPVKPIDLGVNIEDLEGMATDETYFYAVSSQAKPKAIAGVGIIRFKFDPVNQSVSRVESISGLKKFLVEKVAELQEFGDTKGKDGGINIEGLSWDPRNKRLLLGLRSPVIDGHALLIPIKYRDPNGRFTIDNLEVEDSRAIRLNLGGVGIRGIEYNARTNVFQLISGATEEQDQRDFGIWEWNGDANQAILRETKKIDKNLKPEGIARITVGERDFTMVVFDASGYTMLD